MFPLHVLYIRTLFVLFALFLCHTGWADTIVVLGYGKTGKGYAEKVYRALKPNEKLIIVDTNPERVEEAKEWSIGKTTERLFFKGSYKEITEAEWADTVFVQELITENVKEKQTLIAGVLEKLEQQGKSDVVVASNTSSMPVILLAQSLPIRRRHQVAINHIYSPHGTVSEVGFFHILEPDDLIGTEGNLLDAETRRKVALFTAITRQKVTIFNQRLNIASIHLNNNPLLPLKSQIGHSFNRIWFRIKEHFINLVAEKSLNKEMADLAFILLYGRPLGIFGTMDIIGLQTAIDIRHVWHSHGACDTEMPDFVQEMVKAQQTFYGPCTKNHCPQKNIEELWSTRSANLERMEQYSRNHDLYHVQWRSFTDKLITDVLRLKERFPVDSIPTDIQVMEYLEQSPELKFTMFLIASVTVKEYRHTVIENEVIAPETMKTLLSKLDINEHLFEEMNNHFPDSSGITAKKKEEL